MNYKVVLGTGPFPGIIDLFGVGGSFLEYRASLMAGKGFAVMALAYFMYDNLPKVVDILHLKYFEEAVNCLLWHPQVKGPGIGLLGTSKGAELCLSMPSFLKGITAAVIINGAMVNIAGTLYYKEESLLASGMNLERVRVRMTTTGRVSSMPERPPGACRPMGRKSPRSSATPKQGTTLNHLTSLDPRLPPLLF
ncbi:acyl-coenzyme A thioesterase 5-like [Mastomys coucha]|uniref:acyl-coenzyme A thioesterase 5-like n=1 Tax=Mastomys coucha TaxID=35658 RepID=UPI00126247F7|nr:acyl-coenzyme A thioesterase 5-like [Mastomys coucha]